jgi:hypothetical protein
MNMRRGDHCPENELTLELWGKIAQKREYLLMKRCVCYI